MSCAQNNFSFLLSFSSFSMIAFFLIRISNVSISSSFISITFSIRKSVFLFVWIWMDDKSDDENEIIEIQHSNSFIKITLCRLLSNLFFIEVKICECELRVCVHHWFVFDIFLFNCSFSFSFFLYSSFFALKVQMAILFFKWNFLQKEKRKINEKNLENVKWELRMRPKYI